MKQVIRYAVPMLLAVSALSAHGQFYRLKGARVSVGGTRGRAVPAANASPSSTSYAASSAIGPLAETISGQQQFTTASAGVLGSLLFHPKPWAGIEVNYSYTHYSERFSYNETPTLTRAQLVSVPTSAHEATGAYVFHPKHIKFQPFVNVGGGGIFFNPIGQNAGQWRGAGLLETGFDIPTSSPHLAFRVEGRALFYRAPNFNTPLLSSRSWRSTEEPSLSAVYRF